MLAPPWVVVVVDLAVEVAVVAVVVVVVVVARDLQPVAPGGGGSNGGMHGNPPAVFNSDRSKSNEFLEDFKVYRMANQGNQTMRVPLERVALILTYIKGKNV